MGKREVNYTRQFPSYADAKAYLESRGKLEYFGRDGRQAEIYIYKLHLKDGRSYGVNVYQDGLVEVLDK